MMKSEISALLDGELDTNETETSIDLLRRNGEMGEAWDTYNIIGDVMRSNDRAPEVPFSSIASMASSAFSLSVMARLAKEPVVLAPGAIPKAKTNNLEQNEFNHVRISRVGNGGRLALSVAASVMGAVAVGWVALSLNSSQPSQVAMMQQRPLIPAQNFAQTTPSRVTIEQQGALKEYLVAHQAHSPSSRMQGVTPYVRTVSEIHQGGRQ